MASGSSPPGFPPAEIEGEYYWDGGLISNTPLQWVAEYGLSQDTLTFQVDLWGSGGELPRNLLDVTTRQKEIQYSSRTRANADHFKRVHQIRSAISGLLRKLPPELRDSDEVKALDGVGRMAAGLRKKSWGSGGTSTLPDVCRRMGAIPYPTGGRL